MFFSSRHSAALNFWNENTFWNVLWAKAGMLLVCLVLRQPKYRRKLIFVSIWSDISVVAFDLGWICKHTKSRRLSSINVQYISFPVSAAQVSARDGMVLQIAFSEPGAGIASLVGCHLCQVYDEQNVEVSA
jgi:hypothetical protein